MTRYHITHETSDGTELDCIEVPNALSINAALVKLAFIAPLTDGDVIRIRKELTSWDIRQEAARLRATMDGIEER